MPKPAITTFSSVSINQSPTNQNNGLYAPELTQTQIDAIPNNTVKNGGLVYNTNNNTLDAYINNTWTSIGAGGAGDVNGPGIAVGDNIAIFDGVTGKTIKDSGVNIALVPLAPLQNNFPSVNAAAPLVDVNQIGNLGNIQFVNDLGLIFVDALMPLEFITNNFGLGDQVCSLFTGGLPSSSTTPSALVELQTTTGALLLSRLTEVEKDALISAPGMLLFNTDTQRMDINNGNSWNELATTSASDNFASELYLSTASNYIEDAVAQSGHEFAWSPSLKILLRSCILGTGASSTTDGVTWSNVAGFPFTSGCIGWSDESAVFSAIQTGGTGYSRSFDGINWSIVENTTGTFSATSVIYSPVSGRFYAGHEDAANRIYSSIDGEFYDPNTSDREAREFAYGNGVTVAVGIDGPQYITAAAAGSDTWTNSPATFSSESVTFSEELGYFVAVARQPGIEETYSYTSVDGINWTTHTNAFNTQDVKRFIFWIPALAMFVAGGDNEYLAISKDGIKFKQVADFSIGTGTSTYQGIYIDEWGELILGRNAGSVTRTAKRFIY